MNDRLSPDHSLLLVVAIFVGIILLLAALRWKTKKDEARLKLGIDEYDFVTIQALAEQESEFTPILAKTGWNLAKKERQPDGAYNFTFEKSAKGTGLWEVLQTLQKSGSARSSNDYQMKIKDMGRARRS